MYSYYYRLHLVYLLFSFHYQWVLLFHVSSASHRLHSLTSVSTSRTVLVKWGPVIVSPPTRSLLYHVIIVGNSSHRAPYTLIRYSSITTVCIFNSWNISGSIKFRTEHFCTTLIRYQNITFVYEI